MTLQLDIKHLEGLSGNGERLIKGTFRGNSILSRPNLGQNICYFGQTLTWKVARRLEETDKLTIHAFDYSKYFPKKSLGSINVNLSSLLMGQSLSLDEFLVGTGNILTSISLTFDISYRPPDQGELGLDRDAFDVPLTDLKRTRMNADESDSRDNSDNNIVGEGEYDDIYKVDDGVTLDLETGSLHSSVMSGPIRRDPKLQEVLPPTLLKSERCTITVTIIEARELPGTNINPIITINAAGKTQKTDVKLYTNCPYYNNFFSFEYNMPLSAVLDELVRIKVFSLRPQVIARILPGKLIGDFVIDVRTIYEREGHHLLNKWAALIDNKNPLKGPVGYVHVDLAFIGNNAAPTHVKREKTDEDSNIEKNLLLPKGMKSSVRRNLTEFSVKIYRAEGLPPMNTDIITSIKQAFVGEGTPMCDPYVDVSFGGYSAKTKTKKYTYNPIWNQEVVFANFFPPLTHSIRLAIKDWDTLKDETIATHIIDLKKIFDSSRADHLPSFGPSWINLYGAQRTYTYEQMKKPEDELNRNLGEGIAYRGRLLMAIKATPSKETTKAGASVKSTPVVSELVAGKKVPYLLFVAIYGISAVDPKIGNGKKPIQFEVSIGTFGNKIDGKKGGIFLPKHHQTQKKEWREKLDWNESLTDPLQLQSRDGSYHHVEFSGQIPCLYLLCEFEDHRLRMCVPNILEKLRDEYSFALSQIHHLIRLRKNGSARHRLRQILCYKSNIFGKAAKAACLCRGTAPKTPLDLNYQLRVRNDLLKIEKRLCLIGKKLTGKTLKAALKEAHAAIRRVGDLMDCPQHSLPDIFMSMILNNERIGYIRIPARDAYYSASDVEQGKLVSKITTHFMRKPGHEAVGEKGWKMQCQMQMYMWLGMVKDYRAYKDGIPLGYERECIESINPPKILKYSGSCMFQLRCYLFMAKNLLASNSTGFTDPIARVLMNNEMLDTFPIFETMSPMWDLTLIKSNITFHYVAEGVKMNSPQIIVEFFDVEKPDKSTNNQNFHLDDVSYLGRCFCEPNITILGDDYTSPKLQWWQIYRGQSTAGKLLACFDLIQEDCIDKFKNLPTIEEILDFTRKFNERILLGAHYGIPFSDESEDSEKDWNNELEESRKLLDEVAMADLKEPLDTLSVIGSVASGEKFKKKKNNRKLKYGLATPDLVRWRADEDLRLPEDVRLPLGRFRLEVVFWGVRELRRQFLLPVNRPITTVEVGGSRVVSDVIRNVKVNPLFEQRLKYVDLNLPMDENFWPPITIMCHDYRLFDLRITVGLCTLSKPTEFFEDKALEVVDEYMESSDYESDQSGRKKNEDSEKTRFMVDGQNDEEENDRADSSVHKGRYGYLKNDPAQNNQTSNENKHHNGEVNHGCDLENEETSNTQQQAFSYSRLVQSSRLESNSPRRPEPFAPERNESLPGKPLSFPANPMLSISKEILADLDWWSRLYASLNAIDDEKDSSETENEMEDNQLKFEEKLNEIDLDVSEDADLADNMIESDDEELLLASNLSRKNKMRHFFRLKPKNKLNALEKYEKNREKQKNKRRKKRISSNPLQLLKMRGSAKKSFEKELASHAFISEQSNFDETFIETFEIYPMDLEDVPDFGGFKQPIRNFSLYRGKEDGHEVSQEDRLVGYFKGNIMLYPIEENEDEVESVEDLKSFLSIPKKLFVNILARVYILRAINLHPTDPTGTSDPYLVVKVGKVIYNERENYIPKTLRPTFGKMYQFEIQFPMESILHIQILDHDIIGSDDLVGQTTIDLESRFHSPHRATCGLSKNFCSHGYASWRDIKPPTEILEELCKRHKCSPPVYKLLDNCVDVGGRSFFADATIVDETGEKYKSNEPLALAALNNWNKVIDKLPLVPEHVEFRKLTNPELGNSEQGRLIMWVDLFDLDDGKPPPPVDVTPRAPEKWELRVIIHNTSDVVLNDTSVFSSERSSDIYVRGWVKGVGHDDQKTDTHYRSLSGEGNFNWRFIFPFDYMKQENYIVFNTKGPFDIEPVEIKMPCAITLQVWDAELIRSDKFLGAIVLKLKQMPWPAKSPSSCGLHQLEPDCPKLSLFTNKTIRGWWPLVMKDEEEDELIVQGKVEAEFQLVPGIDAENSPVGKAREDPEGLSSPNRPDSSFMGIMNPLNTIRYLIKYKLKWILIKMMIAFFFILIIFLLIYTSPGWISKKIWNA